MIIYKNIKQLLTLASAFRKSGRNLQVADMDIIQDAAIKFDQQKILWVGSTDQLTDTEKNQAIDCAQYVITPELVDSHTHLVFAGDRSEEYAQRLNGVDYQDIAKAGGGIQFTVEKTQRASAEELINLARERVEQIYSYGVGTIEIKSGYGLNYDTEKKITLIIDQLKKEFSPRVQIINTFMAAHAIPKNFPQPLEYLQQVVFPLMNELSEIIDFVDIFHEQGYFESEETKLFYQQAKSLNLKIRAHVDEFNNNQGALLALDYHAYSCDHLLKTDENGIKALAQSNCVATLLPGTALFLGKELAPARKFLDAGCRVAIASDFNPGSCHCDNLLWLAAVSVPHMKMNNAEMWAAMTLNPAHSLGLNQQGAILPGLKPRFSLFKVQNINSITYNWAKNYSVAQIS